MAMTKRNLAQNVSGPFDVCKKHIMCHNVVFFPNILCIPIECIPTTYIQIQQNNNKQCTAADPTSLLLLADLAERSPVTLWRSSGTNGEALAALFQGVLSALAQASSSSSSNNITAVAEKVEASLEAIVQVAIASDVATSDDGSNNGDLARAIRTHGSSAGDVKVNPSSPASHLGRATLPSILGMIGGDGTNTDAEAQRRCMQKLSHAATHCPSLLAGDLQTLTCLIQICLGVAQRGTSSDAAADDDDEAQTASLSSLEVLASLVDVADVRKKIVLTSKLAATTGGGDLLRLMLLGPSATSPSDQNGVVRCCAELIINGVDDDVDSWRVDPPSLQSDAATSWEEDDAAIYAESLLESFLRNLGGGTATLPVVLPLVEALMNSAAGAANGSGWRQYRAALSILERCLDAAPVTFAPHVPVAVEAALNLASNNPCERVQLQALQLLGALCNADTVEDDPAYSPPANATPIQVRAVYGGRILQAASALVASPCAKVSSHACLVLVSFCRGGNGKENCGVSIKKDFLVAYLQDVLMALASGPLSLDISDPVKVSAGAVTVLVRAISAVACLADTAGEDFAPFYGNIMPGLLGCTQFGLQIDTNGVRAASAGSAIGHDFATLRGSAIESATIVGEAVDNESIFVPDAEKIVGIILPSLKAAETGADAVSTIIPMDQLLAASARIACVMGERYAQFMPAVLPHLIKRVREEAEISVVDGNDSGLEATKQDGAEFDEERGTESVTFALPGVGLRKLILNTTQMQEKSQACRAIYAHASALGAAFGPFAAECIDALLPLVTFKYSSDVRSTSAQALGPVFDSACAGALAGSAARDLPMRALQSTTKALVQQLQVEDKDDDETVFALADALSEVLYNAYNHVNELDGKHIAQLSVDEARVTVKQVIDIMKSCLERRTSIIRTIGGYDGVVPNEDESAQLYEQLMAEGRNLTPLVDSIGYTLKSLGEAFVPVFKSVVAPFFSPLLTASGTIDVRARFAAVCLFDDCVEHCGSAAASRYAPYLAEAVVEGMDDTKNEGDEDLKAASIYGVAQIARHAPNSVFDGSINDVMGQLSTIIKSAEGKPKDDIEDLRIIENAVSALASLALFDGAPYAKTGATKMSQRQSLLPTFLSYLPLREDPDEAKICHEGLCDSDRIWRNRHVLQLCPAHQHYWRNPTTRRGRRRDCHSRHVCAIRRNPQCHAATGER